MTELLMKGVELPKGEDVIELTIDSDGCIIFYDGHGKIEQYVEVIQPHGRLIDADEFKASIHMNHLGKFATNRDVQVLYKLLNEAPTVLEASEGCDCTAPDCLDCERNDECNHIGLFEEVSECHRQ